MRLVRHSTTGVKVSLAYEARDTAWSASFRVPLVVFRAECIGIRELPVDATDNERLAQKIAAGIARVKSAVHRHAHRAPAFAEAVSGAPWVAKAANEALPKAAGLSRRRSFAITEEGRQIRTPPYKSRCRCPRRCGLSGRIRLQLSGAPFYARLTNRKNSACLETGSDRAASDAIWCSLSGVNSRASCTFSSSCAIESQPMITVLTGCESE